MKDKAKKKITTEKKKLAADMKIFIIVCSVIAVILIAAVVYLIRPKDVAIVQNSKVSGDEFKYYYAQNLSAFAQLAASAEDPQTIYDYAKQMALSQAIQVEYLVQEAKKEGFKADQKEMDDAWAEMEKNLTDAAAQYGIDVNKFSEQFLGVSLSKAKTIFLDAFTAEKYTEAKIAEVAVDEAKLAEYYEANKETFDYYTVRHILIKCEKDAEEAVEQEKSKLAQDILDRVNKGEDFAALAKEFSEDDGSKDTGGVYDVYQSTNFVTEFKDWTFTHQPGDTGIVRSVYGFHVMKLDAVNNTYETINKDNLVMAYQSNEYQTKMSDALSDGTIKVEILEGYNDY